MLIELGCDKFIDDGKERGFIHFSGGLNLVLGDTIGSNSIGKSSFLLVIDFVFGGTSYVTKATDIQKNVGPHTIKFKFQFEGRNYYFARNTINNQSISICDENYAEQSQISLSEYCKFLQEKYKITQYGLTFRDMLSRYFRICQKDNLNEKKPLEAFKKEKEEDAILSLLKLFNLYSDIESLLNTYQTENAKFKAYKNAVEYDFIPTIKSKADLKLKEKMLGELKTQQDNYLDIELLKKKTGEELSNIFQIKKDLQKLRTLKSRLETKLSRVNMNLSGNASLFQEDFQELQIFFPTINLRKIEEVENFHRQLTSILKEECIEEEKRLKEKLNNIDIEIKNVETNLETYDIPSGISKRILESYAHISQEIDKIENQTKNYQISNELKKSCSAYKQQYQMRLKKELRDLQSRINIKMKDNNDLICDNQRKEPYLELKDKSYQFITPDDTGTGTSYKNLIVFDLSILAITNLPALVHDSALFKNIGDAPIEKILELYQCVGKQVFIALDKLDSYTLKTQEILQQATILELSNNNHELFGYSWGNKGAINE